RSGSSYVPGDKTWSKWRTESRIGKPVGRYLQIKLRLTTDSPLKTPRLKSVSIRAEPEQMGNWTSGIRIVEHHNQEIVRTGMPFRYEPFDHPKLKTLRTRFKLDEVVKGADDEFELMLRLANWASTWGGAGKKNRVGLGTKGPGYPPWDALEILKPMPDGKVWGGFCQQYNLVLLQACESFGIPGRAVSIGGPPAARGGHEVVELWSNQFKKWVYVDGDFNFAVLDSQRRPLSLLELWEEQVRVMNQKQEPQDVQFAGPGAKQAASMVRERGMYRLLRFISRSNFLVQAFPLPLNQGMRGWFWNGHYVWDDPRFPENRLYENRLLRREDVEWTLNQAHFVLEALETPGQLRVHLDTETPGFETFLLRLDGKAENAVPNTFVWPLHQGRNRMEVWPRNIAGREGIKSWIVVDYEDP
ncbi:MAG: transglutaminase-like domain-containing protein, partial [Planctomycetota bacterium]|nr:transglutaminase-like domain-containing protein [Planctomycetota bacterium]